MELNSYQLTNDKVVGEEADSRQKIDIQLYADVMKGMQDKKMICDRGDCLPGLPSIVIEPKPRDTCVERANGEIACGTEISPESIRGGKGKIDFPNPDFIKPDFVKPVPEKPGSGDDQGEGGGKGKPKNPEECRDVGYLLSILLLQFVWMI